MCWAAMRNHTLAFMLLHMGCAYTQHTQGAYTHRVHTHEGCIHTTGCIHTQVAYTQHTHIPTHTQGAYTQHTHPHTHTHPYTLHTHPVYGQPQIRHNVPHLHVRTHTHTHMHTHAHTHTHTHASTHTNTRTIYRAPFSSCGHLRCAVRVGRTSRFPSSKRDGSIPWSLR